MFEEQKETAEQILSTATLLGESFVIRQVQSMLIPHVVDIFADHDHEDLKRMIVTDYDLVENQAPEGVKNTLRNLGSSPETRQLFETLVLESITPENILNWLRNPEEWLDEDGDEEQRERLRKCAEVIEETPGGYEWLEEQVIEVYRIANIVPEDTNLKQAND